MKWTKRTLRPAIVALSVGFVALGSCVALLGTTTRRVCREAREPAGAASDSVGGFLTRYTPSRDLFLRSAVDAGGRIESVEHPALGPKGEALFTDFALFGDPSAPATLVIGSGTHGVEGFTGSGIQSRLLQEGFVSKLPSNVNVLMIHAINPYGMAHLRRFNEDNIDLNRNFRDHAREPRVNEGYEALAGVIEPASLSFWSEVGAWSKAARFWISNGRAGIQAAVSGGQYSSPEGLFYGGISETWSNRTLRSVMGRYLAGSERVVFVDFHTGLGEYGHAEIILNVLEESAEFGRAQGIWREVPVRSTVDGASVSTALDSSLKLALHQIAPPQAEVTAVSLEFGTWSLPKVFVALRAENWLHHKGGHGHPKEQEIKNCLLRAFHPASREWEANALAIGKQTVERALGHLGPANEN